MKTIKTNIWYTATAKATRTRTFLNEQVGAEIDVMVVLNESSSPSWVELCGSRFNTVEEAKEACRSSSRDAWGFNDIRDIKIKRVTETIIRETDDVDD